MAIVQDVEHMSPLNHLGRDKDLGAFGLVKDVNDAVNQ
jgi:hypothetical protein